MVSRLHVTSLLLVLQLAVSRALHLPAQDQGDARSYSFEYGVQDDTSGALFAHMESRLGRVTTGQYSVQLPDGRLQTVKYTADENGYRATVSYEGKAQHPDKLIDKPTRTVNHPSVVSGRRVPAIGETITGSRHSHNRAPVVPESSVPFNNRVPVVLDNSVNFDSQVSLVPDNSVHFNRHVPVVPANLVRFNSRVPVLQDDSVTFNSRVPVVLDNSVTFNNRVPVAPDNSVTFNSRVPVVPDNSVTFNSRVPVAPDNSVTFNNRVPVVPDNSVTFNSRVPVVPDNSVTFNSRVPVVPDNSASFHSRVPVVPDYSVPFNNHALGVPENSVPFNNRVPFIPHDVASFSRGISVVPTYVIPFNKNIPVVPNFSFSGSSNSDASASSNSGTTSHSTEIRNTLFKNPFSHNEAQTQHQPDPVPFHQHPTQNDRQIQVPSRVSFPGRPWHHYTQSPSDGSNSRPPFSDAGFVPFAQNTLPQTVSKHIIPVASAPQPFSYNQHNDVTANRFSYSNYDNHQPSGFSRRPRIYPQNTFISSANEPIEPLQDNDVLYRRPGFNTTVPYKGNDITSMNYLNVLGGLSSYETPPRYGDAVNQFLNRGRDGTRLQTASNNQLRNPNLMSNRNVNHADAQNIPDQSFSRKPTGSLDYFDFDGEPVHQPTSSEEHQKETDHNPGPAAAPHRNFLHPIESTTPYFVHKPFIIDLDASVFHDVPSIIVDYSHRSSTRNNLEKAPITAPYVLVAGDYSLNPVSQYNINLNRELDPNSVANHGIAPDDAADSGNIRLSPGFLPPHLFKLHQQLHGGGDEQRIPQTPVPVQLKLSTQNHFVSDDGTNRKNLPLRDQPSTFGEGTPHEFSPNSLSLRSKMIGRNNGRTKEKRSNIDSSVHELETAESNINVVTAMQNEQTNVTVLSQPNDHSSINGGLEKQNDDTDLKEQSDSIFQKQQSNHADQKERSNNNNNNNNKNNFH